MYGDWTLPKLAHAIKGDLENGMKGNGSFTFSMQQLEHTIIARRNALLKKYELQAAISWEEAAQEINCVPVDKQQFDLCCPGCKGPACPVAHFELPATLQVLRVLSTGRQTRFDIYQGANADDYIYNRHANRLLRHRPYVTLRRDENGHHGFIFNSPAAKQVSVVAVFENPLSVNRYDCCQYDRDNDRFPVPGFMVDELKSSLVAEMSRTYYRFNYKANTEQGQQ